MTAAVAGKHVTQAPAARPQARGPHRLAIRGATRRLARRPAGANGISTRDTIVLLRTLGQVRAPDHLRARRLAIPAAPRTLA